LYSGDVRAEMLDGQELARQEGESQQKAQQTQQVVDDDVEQRLEARTHWQKVDSQVQGTGGNGR